MKDHAFDAQDVQTNKLLGGLGYILFFVPLLACPGSRFGRHCANQGLLMTIFLVLIRLARVILGWIPLIGWIIGPALRLAAAAIVLISLYFLYRAAAQGEAPEFPIIGGIRLLK